MCGERRMKIPYRRITIRWVWIDRPEQDRLEIGIEVTIAFDGGADLSAPRPSKSRQHRIEHSAQREQIGSSVRWLMGHLRCGVPGRGWRTIKHARRVPGLLVGRFEVDNPD